MVRTVRRLFWTFPDGLPGAGLLLIRLGVSGALLYRCAAAWPFEQLLPTTLCAARILSALALLAGIWTPLGAALAVSLELWHAFTDGDDVLVHALLATICVSLILLGPGAWSVDARRFGWEQIDISDPGRKHSSPE